MMFNRKKMKQIAARLDGEPQYAGRPAPTREPALQEYEASLLQLRRAAARVPRAPEINDAHVDAFMQVIREGIETPAPRLSRLWTMASVAAAALVLLLSALAYLGTGSEPVRANEVESAFTELEGVTVNFYNNPQGVSTVQVTMPESDLW